MIHTIEKEQLIDSLNDALCNHKRPFGKNINSIEMNNLTGFSFMKEINNRRGFKSNFTLNEIINIKTGDHLYGYLVIINEDLSDYTIKIN